MTPEVKERIEQIRHGNVPEGYKKGKYSIIPLEWSEEALCNLSDNITKGATPTTYGHTWVEDGVLFLRSDCVSENGFVNREPVYISEDAHKMMTRSVVRAGDILISITGYPGKVGLVPPYIQEANINQHIARVRPLEDRCNPAFVYYYLATDPLKRWFDLIQTGQAYPQLSLEQIREIKMPVPQIMEQQRITEILSVQDSLIELKEKLLAEKQRQKKYLMQEILTGKRRLPGFAEDWKTAPIGDFLESRNTKQIPSEEAPLMAFVAGEGVTSKGERYDRSHLVKDDAKKYKRTELDDFIYSSNNLDVGSIGLNKYGTAVISVVYEIFKMKANVVPAVVSEVIQMPRNMHHILSYRQGAFYGQYRIFAEDFLSVPIRMPGHEEQIAIGEVLNAADREIELLRQDLEQEKQKKKALMQLLLTGIVRVNA